MCPNCNKGLVQGELCEQCKGTGFWNPLSAKEAAHESPAALSGTEESTSGRAKIAKVEATNTSRTPKKK